MSRSTNQPLEQKAEKSAQQEQALLSD